MHRDKSGRSGTVTPDMDREQDDAPVNEPSPDDRSERTPRSGRPAKPARPSSGLRIYKPGQGYYTRIGTAVGSGILIIAGTMFLFNQLGGLLPNRDYTLPVQYGISIAFLVTMSVLVYWIVGLNRRSNDFFIATEGEMKKVNWSSRKEVIRSTKVVITTVVLMAVVLFVFDVLFMVLFRAIGVLKGGPGIFELFGGSKA